MNFRLLKHLLLLIILMGVIWLNYQTLQSGGYEESYRNPLFAIILCFLGMLNSLFWLTVEFLKMFFADNVQVMARLNGDFWTVLFGPVKEER